MTELIKPPTAFWLSLIPFRRPTQKLHTSIGHAKNAIAGRTHWRGVTLHEEIDGIRTGRTKYATPVQGGQIWYWRGEDWELVCDIPAGTLNVRLPWRTTDLKKYEYYVEENDKAPEP